MVDRVINVDCQLRPAPRIERVGIAQAETPPRRPYRSAEWVERVELRVHPVRSAGSPGVITEETVRAMAKSEGVGSEIRYVLSLQAIARTRRHNRRQRAAPQLI